MQHSIRKFKMKLYKPLWGEEKGEAPLPGVTGNQGLGGCITRYCVRPSESIPSPLPGLHFSGMDERLPCCSGSIPEDG